MVRRRCRICVRGAERAGCHDVRVGVPRAARPRALMPYRIYVLLVLLLVYTFNFIDRAIIGILAPPIQAELGINDFRMGLLGGLAFALLYTGLGVPIAWLADRYNRVWIMTAALSLWSGFTALCGA